MSNKVARILRTLSEIGKEQSCKTLSERAVCSNEILCYLLIAIGRTSGAGRVMQSNALRLFLEADLAQLEVLLNMVGEDAWEFASSELVAARRQNIQLLTLAHPQYPLRLLRTYDPPPVLYVRGVLPSYINDVDDSLFVAIVGSRQATSYGLRTAERLARDIVSDRATVVSGLALGIDAAAHEGALRGAIAARSGFAKNAYVGIAVLGSGVLRVAPSTNCYLSRKLLDEGGALLSEFSLYEPASRYTFPLRNRIISGLSDVVIVVEANVKSGALITARLAAEQGREIMCVAGPIDSPNSKGANKLIQQGAYLITSVDDIYDSIPRFSHLKPSVAIGEFRSEVPVSSGVATELLEQLPPSWKNLASSLLKTLHECKICPFDNLVEKLSCSPSDLRAVVTELELRNALSLELGDLVSIAAGSIDN
ncbi:MAG: DNA-protecting protein DprA [Deltaproteobacteria bacterium]|nr:DNA-protecting protein DprA [Deltaproteobacteria bacterium]